MPARPAIGNAVKRHKSFVVSTWVLVVSNAVITSVVGAQVGVGVGVGGGSGSVSEVGSGKGSGVNRGEGSPSEGCRSRFALA